MRTIPDARREQFETLILDYADEFGPWAVLLLFTETMKVPFRELAKAEAASRPKRAKKQSDKAGDHRHHDEGGPMESWRRVWRVGFAPTLPTEGLLALRDALRDDDAALVQGATTMPPPLLCVQNEPCEKADAIAFCGWKGKGPAPSGRSRSSMPRPSTTPTRS